MKDIFLITGTKNQSWLKRIKLREIDKENGMALCVDNTLPDTHKNCSLTLSPNTFMDSNGIDLVTGEPIHPVYAELLHMPENTVYHERKKKYFQAA